MSHITPEEMDIILKRVKQYIDDMPVASTSVLGGVKIGQGLEVDANGTLKVIGYQKAPGEIELSTKSVVLSSGSPSAQVTIQRATGEVSVNTSNITIASAGVTDNVITIQRMGSGTGNVTITVSCAESLNYLQGTETISVTVQ